MQSAWLWELLNKCFVIIIIAVVTSEGTVCCTDFKASGVPNGKELSFSRLDPGSQLTICQEGFLFNKLL